MFSIKVIDTCQYRWDIAIMDILHEWYLPEYSSDIKLLGKKHINCVGNYVDRNYMPVENFSPVIIDFVADRV